MSSEKPQNLPSDKGLKTTLVGIIVSAFLALVKGVGGVLGNSYALIADAIESAADVFTSTMLWLGIKWAIRPPDKNHPYGHGKAEALIALGIGLVLLFAAVFIIYQSIQNIIHPHETPEPFTLAILIIVILAKELLFRFILSQGIEVNSSVIKADAFHHRSDAITSAAAFVGISIGVIGGEGYAMADDYAALLAAGVIMTNAWKIGKPSIGELLDEAGDPEFRGEVLQIARQVPGVVKVQECKYRKMGTLFHVDMHIWVDKKLTIEDAHEIAHNVKDRVMQEKPEVADVHIHVEPD